ncbi:MAG: DUF4258 domain-containing protein [Acidimicrobiales bacterium]
MITRRSLVNMSRTDGEGPVARGALSTLRPVELRFSDHARRRMRQRGIDPAEVAEVLTDSGIRRPFEDAPGRTVVIGATPAGRELFVVVDDSDPQLVITVAERRPAPRR